MPTETVLNPFPSAARFLSVTEMTDSTPLPSRRSWVLAAVAVGMGALLVLSESCECVAAAVVLVAALRAACCEILRSVCSCSNAPCADKFTSFVPALFSEEDSSKLVIDGGDPSSTSGLGREVTAV